MSEGYTVVQFEDEKISEVPIIWLNYEQNICYWPSKDERLCIKSQKKPESNWKKHKCEVLLAKTIGTYENAIRACAGLSSDVNFNPFSSDGIESDNRLTRGKKRRKKIAIQRQSKYINISSDEDSEFSLDEDTAINLDSPTKYIKKSSIGQQKIKQTRNPNNSKSFARNLNSLLDIIPSTPSNVRPSVKSPASATNLSDLNQSDTDITIRQQNLKQTTKSVCLLDVMPSTSSAVRPLYKSPALITDLKDVMEDDMDMSISSPPQTLDEFPSLNDQTTSAENRSKDLRNASLVTCFEHKFHNSRITNEDKKNTDALLIKLADRFNDLSNLLLETLKFVIRIETKLERILCRDGKQLERVSTDIEGFKTPFNTLQQFLEFDEQLAQNNFYKKIVSHLELLTNSSKGGQVDVLVKQIMIRSFPNAVAEKMNIRGTPDAEEGSPEWKFAFGKTFYMKAICDFNLAKGKRTLQSDTLWSYNPDLAVDGNGDTCSFTPRGPDSRWWQVHLGHKFNVVAIGVTISPGSFQEFTIFVIELLADNKALYKPCTTFKGVFKTHKGLFKCNDGLGHPGQFVYIRDDRLKEEYFGLCEVEVFAFRERIPCGDPEVPVNGDMMRLGEDEASYTCNTGYKLEGDATITCSSKGVWQGLIPRCAEVKCSAPTHIANGYIEIGSPKGEYVYNTEAKYGCSPGHVLRGASTRKCQHDGSWSAEAPSCLGVTCGEPPKFENSRYTLLNESSQWTGIAVYSCLQGFKLLTDHDNTVTTCLDSGEWRHINVSCIEDIPLNAIHRKAEGRALDLQSSSDPGSNPQMVIALAVVAAVLAAGMIVFGVLLVRRRLLSGPGSSSPLVRSIEKHNSFQGNHKDGIVNPTAVLPPYIETLGKPTSQYQTNILQGLGQTDYSNSFVYSDRSSQDSESNSGEPPYEKVGHRSDHSYETLGVNDGSPETSYESIAGDKESVGYETVAEPGYESVTPSEPGYEEVKHQYDSLAKEPGYETVQEPSYEVVGNSSRPVHGYETLKPKLPPRDREFTLPKTDNMGADVVGNIQEIPPEVLALYAQVDKSKKKKNMVVPPIATKDLIRKFNSLTSDEESPPRVSPSPPASICSDANRPLPPLPMQFPSILKDT